MRGDKNVRDFFASPVVTSVPLGSESRNLTEFLNNVSQNDSKYTFYNFESKTIDGLTTNIFNDYMAFMLDKTGCFDHFKFDNYTARLFQFKSRSIVKYLYGDTRLWYFAFLFNDISHDSDLSYEYLINHGLVMPNISGLELLKKLSTFKEKIETIDGDASFVDTGF